MCMVTLILMKPSSKWLKYDNDPILRKKLSEVTFPLKKEDEAYVKKMMEYIDASFDNKADDLTSFPG